MKKYFLIVLFAFVIMLPSFVMADLNDGLVAYYPLDGNAKDMSGNGNDGEVNGDIVYVDSIMGKAAKFDGEDDYIVLPAIAPSFLNGLTITAWVVFDRDKSGSFEKIINFGKGPYGDFIFFGRNGSNNDLLFIIQDGNYNCGVIEVSNGIIPGKLHYYSATLDNNTNVKIYRDAELIGTGTTTCLPKNIERDTNYIGRGSWSSDFKGQIDDLRIYNRTLSDSEIKQLFEEGTSNCSAEHLEYCYDGIPCYDAGGYWYDNQCHANPQVMLYTPPVVTTSNAHPSEALEAVEFKSETTLLNPSEHELNVAASSSVYLQPSLKVDSSDVGKTAILVLYIYISDIDYGFMAPSKTVTLESEQKFLNLSETLDFSGAVGISADVYYGYIIGTTFKYNTYRVTVVEP